MKRIEQIDKIIDTLFDNVRTVDEEDVDETIGNIYWVLCDMIQAGDGEIHYSIGDFRISITKDYIDFVDINSGTSLGTLIWK